MVSLTEDQGVPDWKINLSCQTVDEKFDSSIKADSFTKTYCKYTKHTGMYPVDSEDTICGIP